MTQATPKALASAIATHYARHKRKLPWRATKDPYAVWLSEVVLQQTRVEQGLPYYLRLVKRFPSVKHMASAEQEEVLALWEGLGYYSRARNLHAAARQVMGRLGGVFPSDYKTLLTLQGVGPYTAAAVASICNNEAVAAIDGNVSRVLARLFDEPMPIDSSSGKKRFQELADLLLDHRNPGDHNQAMMEFGAMMCTPKIPRCEICPLEADCLASANGTVAERPVKLKVQKKRTRHFHYLDLRNGKGIYLQKRTTKDIWRDLYELPLVESDTPMTSEEVLHRFAMGSKMKDLTLVKTVGPIKHQLTHQTLHINFVVVRVNGPLTISGLKEYTLKGAMALPKPKPVLAYLRSEY